MRALLVLLAVPALAHAGKPLAKRDAEAIAQTWLVAAAGGDVKTLARTSRLPFMAWTEDENDGALISRRGEMITRASLTEAARAWRKRATFGTATFHDSREIDSWPARPACKTTRRANSDVRVEPYCTLSVAGSIAVTFIAEHESITIEVAPDGVVSELVEMTGGGGI